MKRFFLIALVIIGFGSIGYYYWAQSKRIDVVYTWVDGNDERWQARKLKRLAELNKETVCRDSNNLNRFRSRDELKYSLRALYKYAPFVNHIYIVTCGQRPAWFKPHPKITFIHHKAIFQDKTHLPTYNSQAIEAHLHRIPDLAERYIYLNDDFVFTAPIAIEDFYDDNGKIKVFYAQHPIDKEESLEGKNSYHTSVRNTDRFLDKNFGVCTRTHIRHAPYVMKKSVVNMFERDFPYVLSITSSHPFRSSEDYTLTNGVLPYYAAYKDLAVPGDFETGLIYIKQNVKRNQARLEMLNDPKMKMVCIEDCVPVPNTKIDKQVKSALEKKFPDKAPWEK